MDKMPFQRSKYMKTQTYFNTKTEQEANVCDLSKDIIVNCVGAYETNTYMRNKFIRNDFYLIYIIKGKMDIELDGEKHVFSEGQFLIIKQGTDISYYTEPETKLNYLWLHFTGSSAEKKLSKYDILTNKIIQAEISVEVISLWKRMFREFSVNDMYFDESTSSILNEILICLARSRTSGRHREKILKTTIYISENYSIDLTLKKLSEMVGMSKAYYRSCFKEVTGMSPIQYLIDVRMSVADTLLLSTDMPLSAISEEIGFEDVYYFGRLFKKKYGISPGRYRRKSCQKI